MVKKLLQVYENRILNERSKGRLGVLGWGYIIANLVLFILFFVCQLMHWYWGAVWLMFILVGVSIIFIIITNKIMRTTEADYLEFKKETIDKFIPILKELGIDNEKKLTVMIDQCKEYEDNGRISLFGGERFKSIFTLLIYPILAAIASTIVSKMPTSDMVAWSVFIIGMIIVIYIMVALIEPVIYDYVNKYKNIARIMRADLEYIRAIIQTEDASKIVENQGKERES